MYMVANQLVTVMDRKSFDDIIIRMTF